MSRAHKLVQFFVPTNRKQSALVLSNVGTDLFVFVVVISCFPFVYDSSSILDLRTEGQFGRLLFSCLNVWICFQNFRSLAGRSEVIRNGFSCLDLD